MKEYVDKDSLNNIVDFLHALLGFCMEPITDSKQSKPQLALLYFLNVL